MISGARTSNRRWRTFVLILLVPAAAIVVAAWLVVRPDRALRVATGFTSYTLCAEVFVSGLDPEQVYAETLEPVQAARAHGAPTPTDVRHARSLRPDHQPVGRGRPNA